MKPVCVVECELLHRYQRQEIATYLGSFMVQPVMFTLGWLACANWEVIGRMLT